MSSAAPAISVVVPTRDRRERLVLLLDSLGRQSLDRARFEVIVVDDGSRDGTMAMVDDLAAKLPIEVRAVRGSEGRGPAAARNRGWRAASAKLVAFIDDDCEAGDDWLERGLECCRANPGAIVQGRTEPNPRELHLLGPFSRTKLIDGPSAFFQTCNIVYPRELLADLDGFDERFPGAAGEDADLGWRALERGARQAFEPRLVVRHAVERIGPTGFLRQALRGAESAYMYKRHPGLRAEAAYARIFWNQAQALLVLSAAALIIARRFPPAGLLALPYARLLLARARAEGATWMVPFLVAYDLLEAYKAARGSARSRILML